MIDACELTAVKCEYCKETWHSKKEIAAGYVQSPSNNDNRIEVAWCLKQWSDYHRIINSLLRLEKQNDRTRKDD